MIPGARDGTGGLARRQDRSPSASWIMIFFNGERFIDEAIASIVRQEGLDDWELILVDDGSTDDSTAIARRWTDADPARIRYVDHRDHVNRGMSASRNLGIEVARGEVIGFLDCDDVILSTTMARAVDMLDRHQTADAVLGRHLMWFGWTGSERDRERDWLGEHPTHLPIGEVIEPPALFHAMYGRPAHWVTPGICSVVVRREAARRVGMFEPGFRTLYEDHVFYAKVGLDLRVVLDDHPYALYRQHSGSSCAVEQWRSLLAPWRGDAAREQFLNWLAAHVDEIAGRASDEAEVVQANVERHLSGRGQVLGLGWNVRNMIMNSAPLPISDTLRWVRARVRGTNLGRRGPLVSELRASIDSWRDESGSTGPR